MHYQWNAIAKDLDVPTIYPKNGPGIKIEPSEDLTLVGLHIILYITNTNNKDNVH